MSTWFSHMKVTRYIGLVGAEVTLKSVEECIKNKRNWDGKYTEFYKSQEGVTNSAWGI